MKMSHSETNSQHAQNIVNDLKNHILAIQARLTDPCGEFCSQTMTLSSNASARS